MYYFITDLVFQNFYTWFSVLLASSAVLCILSSASKDVILRWGPQTSPILPQRPGYKMRIVKREVREVKSIVQFGEIKTGI